LFTFTRLPRANGAAYAPQMQSSVCTMNSSDGSRRKLFCRRPTPPRCCSGRCSLQGRSTCAKWMVGRPSPQSPSISRLTLPPETIPSCYRRTRHTEFQPHSGRHPTALRAIKNVRSLRIVSFLEPLRGNARRNTNAFNQSLTFAACHETGNFRTEVRDGRNFLG
jgi:hypothetical protein